jgi:hypothetical protein
MNAGAFHLSPSFTKRPAGAPPFRLQRLFRSPSGDADNTTPIVDRSDSRIVGYSEWQRYSIDETTERRFIIALDVGVLAEKEVIPEVLEYLK